MSIAEDLMEELSPLLERADALIEEIKVTAAGKRRMVTILVDHENRSLTLDEVTALSRIISERLDSLTFMGEAPFTLEVSSPGVDRPLTEPRHWRKNVGRLVKVVCKDGSVAAGRIDSFDQAPTIDGRTLSLSEIKRATIEVEFKRQGE